MNANELHEAMMSAVHQHEYVRTVGDPSSPAPLKTLEATLGLQFVHSGPNFVTRIAVDRRWAEANLLHFFTGSEEASSLRKYNRHAEKFLTGDTWDGAYGAIAMPQVRECVRVLLKYPHSRRAVVSMGGPAPATVNRPACWSFVHFIADGVGLHAVVYQRSLSLSVMPYDLVVLSNMLRYVAAKAELPMGELLWTVGSLHMTHEVETVNAEPSSLWLPIELLDSPKACLEDLANGLE